jgi:hypothetical protein
VENEARIRREIQQALDPVVRPAPWLADSIRESLGGRSTRRGWALVNSQSLGWSAARAAVAVLLILAVAAIYLVGSRALTRPHEVPAQPTVDPAVQQYRAVVDGNFPALEHQVVSSLPAACSQVRAPACREQVLKTKDAVQKFQADLSGVSVPPQLQTIDADLRKGLTDSVAALDAMLSDLDRNNYDAFTRDGDVLYSVKLYEVYPAAVAVDCWPRAAVEPLNSQGIFKLVCGEAPSPTATQKYQPVAYADWGLLRTSINSTDQLCADHSSLCRARTLETKRLAQQFLNDIGPLIVPPQLAPFDGELRQGLHDLIAALDNRVAAIDSGDTNRWDAANVSVDQVKFNVIAKAIGEMACWPKGVQVGDDSSTTAWPCTG